MVSQIGHWYTNLGLSSVPTHLLIFHIFIKQLEQKLNFTSFFNIVQKNLILTLKNEGIIQIDREAGGQKEIIKLTEKGKKIAQELFKSISEDHIKHLKRKRKAWDQLGYYGILRKVYEEYPAYRTKSKIKDEIQPSRRWVWNQ